MGSRKEEALRKAVRDVLVKEENAIKEAFKAVSAQTQNATKVAKEALSKKPVQAALVSAIAAGLASYVAVEELDKRKKKQGS